MAVKLPIWADCWVKLGTTTSSIKSFAFSVRVDTASTIIYTGTIYGKTGNANEDIYVNITPILRDYVFAEYPQPDQDQYGQVEVSEKSRRDYWVYQGSTNKESGEFYLDNSGYSLADNNSSRLRNDPITGRMTKTQGFFLTSFGVTPVKVYPDDPNKQLVPDSVAFTGSPRPTTKWITQNISAASSSYDFDNTAPDGRAFSLSIVPDCHRWCLDYLNVWGGWDSLLIEGNWKQIDSYTRGQYRTGDGLVDSSNTFKRNRRDLTDYLNTIGRRYELNTGLLTEDEASRMHNLLGSTQVYLRDLTLADEYCSYACNIVDTECEYKRYNGEGFAQYRIVVELSQLYTRQG